MKAVLQRVLDASVTVEGKVISSIGKGLLVLVGIDRNDTPEDRSTLIKRILSAKLFEDANGGAWKRNVQDIGGELLCVSQFTLLAQFKGTKPDFHESMSTVPGRAFYGEFMDDIRAAYTADKIQDGQFGAMMQVSLTNDGPVTITISSTDSRRGRDKPREGTNTPSASASASTSTSAPASVAASGTNTPKKEKKPKGIGKGRPDNLLSRGTCGGEGVDTVTAQLGDVRLDTSSPAQNAIADGDKGEAIRSQGSDSV